MSLGFDPAKLQENSYDFDYQTILDNWLYVMADKEKFLQFSMERAKIDMDSIADFCHPMWFDFSAEDLNKLTEQNFVSSLQMVESEIKGVCLFSARHVDFTLS